MSTPFDVIDYVLPYIKALIAWNLIKKGLGQRRVARALGTSQALISKYVSRPPQHYLDVLSKLGIDGEELMSVVEIVSSYIIDCRVEDARSYLTMYVLTLLRGCRLCKAHRTISRGLSDCRVCEYLNLGLDDDVVVRVRYAVSLIESTPDIGLVVPEIGMNVVEAKPNAKSIYEVVGIPGRIIRVDDRVKAVSQPTYGGSRFMASLVLRVMKYFPNIRSAINVRYITSLERLLKEIGFRVVQVGPYESRDLNTVLDLVEKSLSSASDIPDAIIDLGPPGFEHLVYILAEDSIRLVNKVSTIVNCLRSHTNLT